MIEYGEFDGSTNIGDSNQPTNASKMFLRPDTPITESNTYIHINVDSQMIISKKVDRYYAFCTNYFLYSDTSSEELEIYIIVSLIAIVIVSSFLLLIVPHNNQV